MSAEGFKEKEWCGVSYQRWYLVLSWAAPILTVVVGLLGSLFSSEITDTFYSPYYWLAGGGSTVAAMVSVRVSAFWSLFVFVVLLFGGLRKLDFIRRQGEIDRQVNATDRIVETVRNQPPPYLLDHFSRYVNNAHDLLKTVREGDGKSTQRKAIQKLLAHVMVLTRRFANDGEGATYGANIMKFVTVDAPEWDDSLETRIKFIRKETDPKKLKGVLDLQRRLSCSSEALDEEGEDLEDLALRPLALPYPRERTRSNRDGVTKWRILPGAPLALHKGEVSKFDDTKQLLTWCKDHALLQDVEEEIRAYFVEETDGAYRSFISAPLISGEQPLGVLNVHRNTRTILTDQKFDQGYSHILSVFQRFLVDGGLT